MSCNNITFLLEENDVELELDKDKEQKENCNQNQDENFAFLDLEQFIEPDNYNNDNYNAVKMVDYHINYTVKGLLHIGEYYGIAKNLKVCKLNKEQIIEAIIMFESIPDNYDIVSRRQKLWYFMNELNKDKFMRKFILCWK